MTCPRVIATAAIPVLLAAAWAPRGPAVELIDRERRLAMSLSPLGPPPPATSRVADDPRAARLGHRLFFDERLSAGGDRSCATCHDPAKGFADGRSIAEGRLPGRRHTPSLWNAAYDRWLFWDGRADSLWSQALHPLESESELASSRLEVARLVAADATLRAGYEAVFGPLPDLADHGAVTLVFVNVGKAIEAYERRLVSRRAPFDVFVEGLRDGDAGKLEALSPQAQRGLKLFLGAGQCRVCHSGPNFSDGEFHNIRVPPAGGGTPRDPGRFEGLRLLLDSPFNAAGLYSDDRDGPAARMLEFVAEDPRLWGGFKTPSLRNVALSPPYMHQGQFATLRDVVEYYSTLEGATALDHHDEAILVPRGFTEPQIDDLVAFLESLTDDRVDPVLLGPPADD